MEGRVMRLRDVGWHVTQLLYETVILAVLILCVKGIELLTELVAHGNEFDAFIYVHRATAILFMLTLAYRALLRLWRAPL